MALVMLPTRTLNSKATKLKILVLPAMRTSNRKTDTATSLELWKWPTCEDFLQRGHPRDRILLSMNIPQQYD